MQSLTRLLLNVMILITALASATAAQERWENITDHEAGFTIRFPGKPTYLNITNPITNEPMENYSFAYNLHHLQIMFWQLAEPPESEAEAIRLLNSASQVYARGAGKLLRQEKLPDGGRQFENIKIDSEGTLHLLTRIYLHHGKFYQLAYGTYAPDGIDERIAERFFSSFRFLNVSTNKQPIQRRNQVKKSSPVGIGQSRWYTLRGEDGDFKIEFPGKPSRQVTPGDEAGTTYYQYNYVFGEDTFMLSYRERYSNESTSSEEIIRGAAANVISKYGNWRVLRQSHLRDGGYEVESEEIINGSLMRMRSRLYMRGSRLYFVTGFTKSLARPESENLKRYFASFRLQ